MKKLFAIIIMAIAPYLALGQSVLTVKEMLSIRNTIGKEADTAIRILNGKGYTKTFRKSDTDLYFYKNCKLVVPDDRISELNGVDIEASPRSASASIVHMYSDAQYGALTVTVYSKALALKWVSQLKELGYRDNGEGGIGPRSRDWYYSKPGFPDISLWNDNGTTYVLGVDI